MAAGNTFDRVLERAGLGLAAAACLWFFLAAAWGIFAIPQGGHFASTAAAGVMADNMWHWKILAPVWEYTDGPPSPSQYYCHHPWGVFWLTALFFRVFGYRDFVLVLPAVVMSALTPALLFSLARRAWGVLPGAAAACGFVLVPIAISFANFNSLEVMTIFGCTLSFWGLVHLNAAADPSLGRPPLGAGKRRYLVASLVGTVFAGCGDWPGYIAIGVLLAWCLLRLYVFPRTWLRNVPVASFSRWWALTASVAVLTFATFVVLFIKAEKLSEWIGAAVGRGAQDPTPISAVLEARKFWIETAFTPLVIFLGKLAVPVAVVRLIVKRTEAEVFSLASLVMAVIQYVMFKQGADIHFFWPHYFVLYFALALAQLVATAVDLGRLAAARLARVRPSLEGLACRASAVLALLVFLIPSLLLVPDAPRVLRYARETGGRFDEHGNIIRSETDLVRVAQWLRPRLPERTALHVEPGFPWGWHHSWALRGITRSGSLPPKPGPDHHGEPYWIGRASLMDLAGRKRVMGGYYVQTFGDVWVVETRRAPAPLDAWTFEEREPGFFEWYFSAHVEPVTRLVQDPLATWELRLHYGQEAPRPAPSAPRSLEDVRVLHNLAVDGGDAAEVGRLRAQIDAALDRSTAAEFTQGVRMIGSRVTPGVQPRVQAWFEAQGPTEADALFDVRSRVIHPKRWSWMPQDPSERNCAYPPVIPTATWRRGFLYVIEFALFKRFGDEVFSGAFTPRTSGPVPQRKDGQSRTTVALVR